MRTATLTCTAESQEMICLRYEFLDNSVSYFLEGVPCIRFHLSLQVQ